MFPATLLARELGNLYCGSVYGGLASLVNEKGDDLLGKRVMIFSYGSGMAASLFSVRITGSLIGMVERLQLRPRLSQRLCVAPTEFSRVLKTREERYGNAGWKATEPVDAFFPGTFYLTEVDSKYRRFYQRTAPKSSSSL